MHDVHEAGGVPAIINELMKKDGTLHPERITVTGKTLKKKKERKLQTLMLYILLIALTIMKVDFQYFSVI